MGHGDTNIVRLGELYDPEETKVILQQAKGYIYSQVKLYKSAIAYIQQLEREKEALLEYIRGRCFACRHNLRGINEEPCASCVWYKDRHGWEWRGVEEDGHGID